MRIGPAAIIARHRKYAKHFFAFRTRLANAAGPGAKEDETVRPGGGGTLGAVATRFGANVVAGDRVGLLRDVAACMADLGVNIEAIHHDPGPRTEMHLELRGDVDWDLLCARLRAVPSVEAAVVTPSPGVIFGKRVVVIGGGAQVAQVVLGAVSEADRHNIRGERISVDTIPLVGESKIAEAVRAVAALPRARVLVLAGSLMGGEITSAVRELRDGAGIPVVSLAMAGSVADAADLVVSDPVQAGVMAVMAIAETAAFDLARVRGRRF